MKKWPDQEAKNKFIRPELGPYCERGNPLVDETIKIIEGENRELKNKIQNLETEKTKLISDMIRFQREEAKTLDENAKLREDLERCREMYKRDCVG